MRSQRLYQIIKTFLQYGLDELLPGDKVPWYGKLLRLGFFWLRNQHKDKSIEQRFRLAIESLGPVYIKFGQMLSTRRDLLTPAFAEELARLQDNVEPFDGALARQRIVEAIGLEKFAQAFIEFDQQPLASASIAQVHSAKMLRAEDSEAVNVVIKVIRPGIESVILADIKVMQMFAKLVSKYYHQGKRLRPEEVVDEYRKTIIDELDLLREAANSIQLKRNFVGDKVLYVPEVYSDYCTQDVMVMERIYGIGVGEVEQLKAANVNMQLLAERGVEVFFTQVFRDSFFHADMHPGNVFVDVTDPRDPTWIAIDCGIVGTLNKEDKRYLAENFVAFFNRDYYQVAQLHVDSGWVPADTNVEEFEFAIRTVCEPIFEKPLSEISFGQVLINLFNTARRFDMEVQPQLVLLQKTLLYIEGLGRQLYPELDLWKTAKPFLEGWVKEQMGPKALFNQVKEKLPFWGEKLPEIPDLFYDYLKTSQQTKVSQLTLVKQMQQQHQQSKRLQLTVVSVGLLIAASVVATQEFYQLAGIGGIIGLVLMLRSLKD